MHKNGRLASDLKEPAAQALNVGALLRKFALSLLKQNPTIDSIARKRKAAALDLDFLAEIMAGAAKLQKV